MRRPVDKSSSTGGKLTAIEKAVALIEKDAASQSAEARATYAASMKPVTAEYQAKRRELAAAEASELKRIERWRIGAIAKIEGRPIPLSDVRSVKREDAVRSSTGVSLPRLSCLDRRA